MLDNSCLLFTNSLWSGTQARREQAAGRPGRRPGRHAPDRPRARLRRQGRRQPQALQPVPVDHGPHGRQARPLRRRRRASRRLLIRDPGEEYRFSMVDDRGPTMRTPPATAIVVLLAFAADEPGGRPAATAAGVPGGELHRLPRRWRPERRARPDRPPVRPGRPGDVRPVGRRSTTGSATGRCRRRRRSSPSRPTGRRSWQGCPTGWRRPTASAPAPTAGPSGGGSTATSTRTPCATCWTPPGCSCATCCPRTARPTGSTSSARRSTSRTCRWRATSPRPSTPCGR